MKITAEQLKQLITDCEPGSNHTFYFIGNADDSTGIIMADLRTIAGKLNEFFNGAGTEASVRV